MQNPNYDPWRTPLGYTRYAPRYYAVCSKCGEEKEKKRMMALYVKRGSYAQVRVLCHFCESCFVALLDELGVAMPE